MLVAAERARVRGVIGVRCFAIIMVVSIALGAACVCSADTPPEVTALQEADVNLGSEEPIDLQIGGCGGVYLFAEPGELIVEVEKRDRHLHARTTDLRALLVSPDRHVLQEEIIPDDGGEVGSGLGEPGRVVLSTQVERPGIYALNVTVTQDRYGDEIAWGFRTNCEHYLIETSRGHRDARHVEPLVLLNPGVSGDVCFLPWRAEIVIDVSGVPDDVDALALYDGDGNLLAEIPVDDRGSASHTVPAADDRGAVPWRLHMPRYSAIVQIDGVTRWERGEPFENLSLWTPHADSWFPFHQYRRLVTPYSRKIYGEAGKLGEYSFRVHSNARSERSIGLALEFPEGAWDARIPVDQVALGADEGIEVPMRFTVPPEGEVRRVHLRATPQDGSGLTTYATLEVHEGEAPAEKPFDPPLTLKPYAHENEQLGYLPTYPVENEMYFDLNNQPYARTARGVATRRNGEWVEADLRECVTEPASLRGVAIGRLSTKLAFDADNDLYLLGTAEGEVVLLRSTDGARTFDATVFPSRERRGSFDIDNFSGHNTTEYPPAVVRYTRTAADPNLIWRRIHDLELFAPRKVNGRIEVGEPILISDMCIGLSAHSGIPSSVVSQGSKIHVAWGEATDPELDVPGVPTYVATYDRETGELSEPALVGYGPPANDVHNSPSITIDSEGYLHVLIGTHGRPFGYARSLQPNDASGGWTESRLLGDGLSQTYVGFVCGPDDTLHSVFRLWRSGVEPHPRSSFGTLAHQAMPRGQFWGEPQVLVVPPFSEYSVYYHRLTIDRRGRLFLSKDCWSTFWFYRNDHVGDWRTLMTSPDGGRTWKMVTDADFE